MINSTSIPATFVSALAITCALAMLSAQPAAAQIASNVRCNKCVDKRDIAKRAITKDRLKNNAVTGPKIRNGAVTGAKIGNGAVTLDKLGSDVTALGLEGVIVIPAFAFIPEDEADDYRHHFNGYTVPGNTNTTACSFAPVYLPDGVVISQYEAVVLDSSATGRVLTSLRTLDLSTGATDNMGEASTSNADVPGFTTLFNANLDPALVNAVDNTYFMTLCLVSDGVSAFNTRFYGARVFYQ